MVAARITVIDGHAEFRAVLNELLTNDGYQVNELSGDGTTIEEIAVTQPDVLILDLIFAGGSGQMSGWEYLTLIRSHARLRTVPILVCSGDAATLRKGHPNLPGDTKLGVLAKPFSVDQVQRAISELLNVQRVPEWDDEREIVLMADASSRLIGASSAALRTLGMSLEQLRLQSVADIVARDADWTQEEWRRYQAARRWEGPVRLRRVDGTEIEASATAEIIGATSNEVHISRLQVVPPSLR